MFASKTKCILREAHSNSQLLFIIFFPGTQIQPDFRFSIYKMAKLKTFRIKISDKKFNFIPQLTRIKVQMKHKVARRKEITNLRAEIVKQTKKIIGINQ